MFCHFLQDVYLNWRNPYRTLHKAGEETTTAIHSWSLPLPRTVLTCSGNGTTQSTTRRRRANFADCQSGRGRTSPFSPLPPSLSSKTFILSFLIKGKKEEEILSRKRRLLHLLSFPSRAREIKKKEREEENRKFVPSPRA